MSHDYAIVNPTGRPRARTMEQRLHQLRVVEKASQYADEIVELHVNCMRNEAEPSSERRAAGKWLWEAAFGKPKQQLEAETAATIKHIYNIRWLPPDPNDTSRVIEPEKD